MIDLCNKTVCEIRIDEDGRVIQPSILDKIKRKDFFTHIDELLEYVKDAGKQEKLPADVELGMQRYVSWKSLYFDDSKIPDQILNELRPALAYYYEHVKGEN